MSTFSTRAIILVHHGTGTLIDQPILLYSPVHNLFFLLCTGAFFLKRTYSCVLKCVPILCPVFFCICQKNIFHFYISNELTNPKGIFM